MPPRGRHLARRCAVQALYQWHLTGQPPADIRLHFIADPRLTGKPLTYFSRLIKDIPTNIDKIDALIAPHLDRPSTRLDLTERAILRLATYELTPPLSLPPKVVITEAITLANLFCSQNAYRYINAVLDKIAHTLPPLSP